MEQSFEQPNADQAEGGRIGEFVRGYFCWLEERGIKAAVLHDWEEGFDGNISDVDHVLEPGSFERIASLVHEYCKTQKWRLCQVLRHENTAAFCVCSALDDPACVVALDACSDYRRNGYMLMRADVLLEARERLEWGGWRLAPQIELRYRAIKASAKAKSGEAIIPELLAMPESARDGFSSWLLDSWCVTHKSWSYGGVHQAMMDLGRRCGPEVARRRISHGSRMIRRVLYPDGLLVTGCQDETTLIETFSGLYFRNHHHAGSMGVLERKRLLQSNLVIATSASGKGMWALDRDCVLYLDRGEIVESVANHLHERCLRREGIRP